MPGLTGFRYRGMPSRQVHMTGRPASASAGASSQPVVVPRGIAEADLIQLRALHEEVHVVLPGEPDSPWTWSPEAITRFAASEHQILAAEAAELASELSAAMHQAA